MNPLNGLAFVAMMNLRRHSMNHRGTSRVDKRVHALLLQLWVLCEDFAKHLLRVAAGVHARSVQLPLLAGLGGVVSDETLQLGRGGGLVALRGHNHIQYV